MCGESTSCLRFRRHLRRFWACLVSSGRPQPCEDNNYLGKFTLKGIPKTLRGVPKIKVGGAQRLG